MGEILSHAEVEAILSAIKPPSPEQRVPAPAEIPGDAEWAHHDFSRPEPLQGSALKIVQALQSGWSERFRDRLRALLQIPVEMHPVGACQTTGAEFFSSLHACCTVCQLAQPNGTADAFLVWNTDLLRSMFVRMLGGEDAPRESSTERLTRIEHRLLTKLNDLILSELARMLNVEFIVTAVHDSAVALSSSELAFPSIWLSFELHCGPLRGIVHAGFPRSLFRAIGSSNPHLDCSTSEMIPPGIQRITVQLSASLAKLRIRTADIASLQIGDILMTDQPPSGSVTLQLGDQHLCQSSIGTHQGRKALRLIQSPQFRPVD